MVVNKDGEGIHAIEQLGSTDDTQVFQRQEVKLVEANENIARNLPNRLWVVGRRQWNKVGGSLQYTFLGHAMNWWMKFEQCKISTSL